MKKLLSLLFIYIICFQVLAVPANPEPVTIQLPNGEELTLMMRGDEFMNWAETSDGYTLLVNSDFEWSFAQLNDAGDMVPSSHIATDFMYRSPEVIEWLQSIDKNLFYSREQVSNYMQLRELVEAENTKNLIQPMETRELLVILMEYPDRPFTKTAGDFYMLLNQINYTLNGHQGSMRDFYLVNSYNTLEIICSVVGPYMAANNAATYVNNGRVLASEAIRAAYNNGVNLAPFVQGNALPSFYVIYAGYGGASGCQTCIWEHASSISPPISVGGVWVSKYACSSELASTAGSRISGIGVVCHEYGHSLGMPDYYDTNGADGGQFDGTGQWDLMASGSWNGTGASVPAPHNPRSKMKLGWINPIVLNSPQTVTIPAGRIYRDAFFRINTPVIFFPEQYFLIENKIRDGFDKHVPGQNLLIYRATEPYEQSQNTTSPQRFYPVSANAPVSVPASGSGSASQYGNINRTSTPWPGSNNKTTFDNTSIPGMVTWNGGGFNQPITNITVYDDYITFDFMGGGLKTDFYIFLPYFYGCNFVPVSGSVSPTNKGESFSFRADLLPTFVLGEVTANHVKLTPSGGIYTITNVQEDQIIRISSLVSVNGYEDQNDEITIYPNPTTGKLTIESKDLVIKNIEILDIMGRKVSSHQPISSSHQQIDISHLTTGIYFVQLQTANGMITKKVVKE